MLTEVERGEKRQKLGSKVICGIIKVSVEVADNDEFVRRGSNKRKERISL